MTTHVVKKGAGYWDITTMPHGGAFRRAGAAFGVTLMPDRRGKFPDEVVVSAAGRILCVKRNQLVSLDLNGLEGLKDE